MARDGAPRRRGGRRGLAADGARRRDVGSQCPVRWRGHGRRAGRRPRGGPAAAAVGGRPLRRAGQGRIRGRADGPADLDGADDDPRRGARHRGGPRGVHCPGGRRGSPRPRRPGPVGRGPGGATARLERAVRPPGARGDVGGSLRVAPRRTGRRAVAVGGVVGAAPGRRAVRGPRRRRRPRRLRDLRRRPGARRADGRAERRQRPPDR